MISVSYSGKNAYSAGKTSSVLRGGASGANRWYVLAHCAPPTWEIDSFSKLFSPDCVELLFVFNTTICHELTGRGPYGTGLNNTVLYYHCLLVYSIVSFNPGDSQNEVWHRPPSSSLDNLVFFSSTIKFSGCLDSIIKLQKFIIQAWCVES